MIDWAPEAIEAAHLAMFQEPYDGTTAAMIGAGLDAAVAAQGMPTDSALREENARLREVLIDTLASLVASVDLLECGGKKAAPSDKMFEQMLVDYKNTIERGRYAAAIREKRSFATEGGKDDI